MHPHLMQGTEVVEHGLQLVVLHALALHQQLLDVQQHERTQLHDLIIVRTRAV